MGGRIIPVDEGFCDDYLDQQYALLAQDSDRLPNTVEVTVLVGDNASVAHIRYDDLQAFGDAKRNKGERRIPEVGQDLALGRAFIDLGRQLIDRALETLDCQEA